MANYSPGDAVYAEFCTQNPSTGAATNADSLPTGTVNQNGTDDGTVTVTVTNKATGRYIASFTIPSGYSAGDVLNLSISATVNSIAGKNVIWSNKIGGVTLAANQHVIVDSGTVTNLTNAPTAGDFT